MKLSILTLLLTAGLSFTLIAQTVIPNAGFENWTTGSNYSDPVGWDTPNQELMAIPFFGFQVCTKSTDHHGTGSFSAKLETKHLTLPPLDIPGFMTCGTLTVDLTAGTFVLSGGVPVVDIPTHLKGFYKYQPRGGDSCVIGIGLTRWESGGQDTVGMGSFSTKDTVPDWTPFSAWIDYVSTLAPDTMNIIAMSTAQEVMTVGTVLYVDDLWLDYTVGYNSQNPAAGLDVYNDQETGRLMLFFDFPSQQQTTVTLVALDGKSVVRIPAEPVTKAKKIIDYRNMPSGVYLLVVDHGTLHYTRKFYLVP